MRDGLPSHPRTNECTVVNLDSHLNKGTHWVVYRKEGDEVEYFDSFDNFKPPRKLVTYLGKGVKIFYNNDQYQDFNEENCGHLCLKFLYKNDQ